jgi:hypothetical protein
MNSEHIFSVNSLSVSQIALFLISETTIQKQICWHWEVGKLEDQFTSFCPVEITVQDFITDIFLSVLWF